MLFASRVLVVVSLCFLGACASIKPKPQYRAAVLPVQASGSDSNVVFAYIRPYRDSLAHTMDAVIAHAEGKFVKEKPGGSLGNLLCDALLTEARLLDSTVLMAISNYGGIRVPHWSEGPIALRQVYELMPFDNMVVLLDVPGSVMQTWLKHVAHQGGWPCAGMQVLADTVNDQYALRNANTGQTLAVLANRNYKVATTDYVASGGDKCSFLVAMPRTETGILLRDAIIDYVTPRKQLIPDPQKRFIFSFQP